MSDYIERQAVIDAIHEEFDECVVWDESGKRTADEVESIIDRVPSADVVQVVHGRWIKYTGMGKEQWMCSECSAEEKNPKVANYCYHCGAKMDGGK